MPTRQPTEESPDTTPFLRVLTARRKGDWRTCVQHVRGPERVRWTYAGRQHAIGARRT
jgi:hypothetical protein